VNDKCSLRICLYSCPWNGIFRTMWELGRLGPNCQQNKMKSDDFVVVVVVHNAQFDQNIDQYFNMESIRVIDMHNAHLTKIFAQIFKCRVIDMHNAHLTMCRGIMPKD